MFLLVENAPRMNPVAIPIIKLIVVLIGLVGDLQCAYCIKSRPERLKELSLKK